jgi:phage gp46-like protein
MSLQHLVTLARHNDDIIIEMTKDILLTKTSSGYYDIDFGRGEIIGAEGMDTAIIMSLFTNKRADESEVANPIDRGGNIMDELNNDPNFEIGSKLWLLRQSRANQDTLNRAESYINECLQWMIEDNIAKNISVSCSFYNNELISNITIQKADNTKYTKSYKLWANTINA